ncbi:ATP synthase subunit a [Bacteroidia bacterium]|nr:ATP synthase subunit a [Bacteroidia bacterium]
MKLKGIFILALCGGLSWSLQSQEVPDTDASHGDVIEAQHVEAIEVEAMNPGKEMIGHIIDAHEWHIVTYKTTHITISLPILLIYDGQFYAFWSSKFHHGHALYKGFGLNEKGHIEHFEANGQLSAKQPLDFSLTKNAVSLLITTALLLWLVLSVAKAYKRRGSSKAPTGLQNLMELIIVYIRDTVALPAMDAKHANKYLPYLLTLFFFILINNLMGLIPIFPGGANVSGSISITFTLAMLTFLIVNFSSTKNYWGHIFNDPGSPWWLKIPLPLMPVVEFVGVITKPVVLMIRLFANMTAGHIIVMGFIFLIFILGQISPAIGFGVSPISVFFALFISALELLVSFIQAYIFTLLTALYIGDAVAEPHHSKK